MVSCGQKSIDKIWKLFLSYPGYAKRSVKTMDILFAHTDILPKTRTEVDRQGQWKQDSREQEAVATTTRLRKTPRLSIIIVLWLAAIK